MRDHQLLFPTMREKMHEKAIQIDDAENPWIVLFQHILDPAHKEMFDGFSKGGLYPTLAAMAERDESQHTAWYWLSTTIIGRKIFSDLLDYFSRNDELEIPSDVLSEVWGKLVTTDDGIELFYRLMRKFNIFPEPANLSGAWGLLDQAIVGGNSVTVCNIITCLLNNGIFPAPGAQFQNFWQMQSISTSIFAKLIQHNILPHDEITWQACYFAFKRKVVTWAIHSNYFFIDLFGNYFNAANGFSARTLICNCSPCDCQGVSHRNMQHLDFIRRLILQKAGEYRLLSTMVSCWDVFHKTLIRLADAYVNKEMGGKLGKRRVINLLTELRKLSPPFVQIADVQKLVQLYCAILYSSSDNLKESFLACLEGLRRYVESNFEDDKTFSKRLLKEFQEEQDITEDSCRRLLSTLEAEPKAPLQTVSLLFAERRRPPNSEERATEMHLP